MSESVGWDPLDTEFRKLEAEVRRRDCGHSDVIDITQMGGPHTVLCRECGATFEPEPLT